MDAREVGTKGEGLEPIAGDAGRSDASLRASLATVGWIDVLGFALCQAWSVLCVALPDPLTYVERSCDLRWLSLATALVLSAAIVAMPRLRSRVSDRRAYAGFAAVASAGSILGPVSWLFPTVSGVLIHVAAIAVGMGFAWLFVAWYVRLCARRDLLGIVCAVAAAAVLTYPLANVLTSDQLNTWVSSAIGSVLPLLSAALMWLGRTRVPAPGVTGMASAPGVSGEPCGERSEGEGRWARMLRVPRVLRESGGEDSERGSAFVAACAQSGVAGLAVDRRRVMRRFLLALLVVAAVIETVRNLLLGGTALTFYSGVANVGGLALKVACAVWLASIFDARNARGASVVYRLAFLLLLGVILCFPILLQGNWAAHMLLDVSSFFFQLVMVMVAYQMCVGFKVTPAVLFGCARAVWAAAVLLGILTDAALGHGGREPGAVQALTVVLGLAVAAVFVFAFTDRDCVHVLVSVPREAHPARFRGQCAALGEAAGLSPRELEVMLLTAKGHSAARMAQDLGVSLATVNTHVHHVYQKLDVHSRQELIDKVEGRA